ncbi:MAG TPA: response regulator FixJ [Vineibacter sp.]|nr:response regulator FixJ [Vineibacter sp.]
MAGGGQVFVVDDDEAIRDSLDALLGASGFDVCCFGSPVEFLAWLKPERAGCLLVDVRMPEMSGLDLQKAVTAAYPGVSIVMMTGHADVPMAVAAMKAGAVDFIEKPFAPDALLKAVQRAMAQSDTQGRAAAERELHVARLSSLSTRERQVLSGLVAGEPNKVIAHKLQISPRTVEIYRARLMDKMQARSLSELVRAAVIAGVTPDEGDVR